MVAVISSDSVSMTCSAPGDSAIATYTLRPSGVIAMLLGRPTSSTCLTTFSMPTSTTSMVSSDSLATYSFLPSGAGAAPWARSIPWISPTTSLVAGSMMCTLSPALLVCTMRTVCAAAAAGMTRAAAAARAASLRVVAIARTPSP